jgi:hypothetical protein
MPRYNLTQTQTSIIVTWLFEPNGYLDFAKRQDTGQSAREALALDPDLDVVQWVRDHPQTEPEATETAMVWWIWKHDQVNVTPPSRPPEAAAWTAILAAWDASIQAGFDRGSQAERDSKVTQLYDENGVEAGTFPSGAHLAQQQQIITKVTGVLS